MARRKPTPTPPSAPPTTAYRHPEATTPLRPEVGTQPQFQKKKAPAEYRYDSSLSPSLEWDGQNGARELGEWLLARIEEASRLPDLKFPSPQEFKNARGESVMTVRTLADAVAALKRLSRPFLNWAGKSERLSFEVPTLPLFVHERLSTKAILESLRGHRHDKAQGLLFDLFGDPEHSITEQVLKAYEHQDKWVNRLILGDSLVVMNSLLKYEGLGGQVQMIYIDPPYGVEFGSNFQPFVRKRDVTHNDDEDMTREPETVKAYRDTWELGLHSYLTYLRDRLRLAHELLHATGSVFVQISDQNVHHVREVLDEVFGPKNFVVTLVIRKKGSQRGNEIRPVNDYILWFARQKESMKRRFLYDSKLDAEDLADEFEQIEFADGTVKSTSGLSASALESAILGGAKLYTPEPLTSGGEYRTQLYDVIHEGRTFRPPANNCWKFSADGMRRIQSANRLHVGRKQIRFKKYHTDFPFRALSNLWLDLAGARDRVYAVQTAMKVLQRCILMTTDSGDLVLDPTCGSGTTAYVAEQWGRRWITTDTSRVPLALARQRLLTATFPFYRLLDESRGPIAGFLYARKSDHSQAAGGIVEHTTSTTIANELQPAQELLVDRPEVDPRITRITGPFVVEGTIPAPIDWDNDGQTDTGQQASTEYTSHKERMLEVLRRSPVLHLGGNQTVTLQGVRPPAKTLSLSAEARIEGGGDKLVAIVFGPENGAIAENLVFEAAKEANGKGYAHLYVIGFAIAANARTLVAQCEATMNIAATYVQCTPDLMMGDLLKNLRSSQIFSVCGLPDAVLRRAKDADVRQLGADPKTKDWYQVELLGLDVYDPAADTADHRAGDDVPCWMVDADYNGLCFKATQVFFPRTAAWDDLRRDLKGQYDESVWAHLAGSVSTPFRVGEHGKVAVKVIDDRGNELLVVKDVGEARG